MKVIRALALCVLLIYIGAGCSYLSKKQTGIISTAPAGAKITIRDSVGVFRTGLSPMELEVWQGAIPVRIIIEKEGYKTIEWEVPKRGSLNRHFELEKTEVQ